MFEKLIRIFKIKDLRKRILYTLVLLVVFRIAAHIPVPGVNAENLQKFFEGNQLFGLLDIFTGGGLARLSVVMMGVGPYITASIIMQLLVMVFPRLAELYREAGEAGRRKFNQLTRYLAIPLAALQSYAMIIMLSRLKEPVIANLTPFNLVTTIMAVTAGTMFLMWIGELISENGIGNGISLIIFAGIIAGYPTSLAQTFALVSGPADIITMIVFIIIAILLILGIIIVTEGQRNIPVSFAKRIRGNKMYGGTSTYLPLRVNMAGMIPIIFGMSVILFPGMIANFLAGSSIVWLANIAQSVAGIFENQLFYAIVYFVLVAAFTFFYTAIIFEPKNVAENLQKQGGFIPGKRPGNQTAEYLAYVTRRVTLASAIFLGFMAVVPFIAQSLTHIQTITLSGASLIIIVSVILETMKQIRAQLVMRDYEGF